MTASATQEDRDACHAAGMDDFISKPIRLDDLRPVLEHWTTLTDESEDTRSDSPGSERES